MAPPGGAASSTLGRYLAARVAERRIPGAAWWVEDRDGVIDRGTVGQAVLEPRPEPAAETTPYDLASLTKALVTAPLLLLLEQEGRIDLEAPLTRWLPELADSRWAAATPLALATHTAGLAAWRPLYLHAASEEGLLARLAAESPAVPAGRTLYSDLGYILLGMLLRRAGEAPLDELFRRRIAAPLGCRRLGFPGFRDRFTDAAASERGNVYERAMAGAESPRYRWRESIPRGQVHDANAWNLGGVAGHAGLFGTAHDVAALAREMLSPRPFGLRAPGRRRLLEVAGGSRGRTVGMVVAAQSRAACGILPSSAPGHTGFTGTSLWLDPDAGRIYVLLTNRVHPRVPRQDFQLVRRGFHRLAARLAR